MLSHKEETFKRTGFAFLSDLTQVMDQTHQIFEADMSGAARMLTGRFKELKQMHDQQEITLDTYLISLVPLSKYLKKYPDYSNKFLIRKEIEAEIAKLPIYPGLQ